MDDNWLARLDHQVVFFACDAFISGMNADWIARSTRERFTKPLHRTQVYQVISEGRRRGYFQLTPPRDEMLSRRMLDRFVHSRPGATDSRADKVVKVVSQGYEPSLEHVAVAGAATALKVIRDKYAKLPKPRARKRASGDEPAVHVGFGAGSTTMLVARHLAEMLRAEETPPHVVLHALSSGFSVKYPATAPVAFFNFFHGNPFVSYRGMFAPAYVKSESFDEQITDVGVRESFQEKKKIQIIVTALASQQDPHGELNRFMAVNEDLGREARKILDEEEHRKGDVMYRPFNEAGPITRSAGIRAVTLYELAQLRDFVHKEKKAVILVAGPCSTCQRSRSDALLPLLREPSLDLWSHLVTDDETATRCLRAR
jgi:DNA-binding transcriptional regulator LsrR (DeoR family)